MNARLTSAVLAALAALAAVPAAAQVNGIGVTNPQAAIFGSKALSDAYGTINSTYAAQITQLQQSQQQRDQLLRQFDTDQNGNLSEAETAAAQANAAAVQQLQTLNQAIAQAQRPISLAQIYVVEQIAMQYSAALQQVITQKSVQLILEPEAVAYAPEAAVLTDDVITALDQLIPAASTAVPDGWQPQQQSVAVWEAVQELIATVAQMRQAQAQQQPAAQQPATPVQGR
jgi:Skp family chaperone for outer membrane proteins